MQHEFYSFSRCIVCNSAVAIAAKCRVIHPCSEVSRSSMWLHDAISLGCSVSRLLTRHNQEITQWSPDPFPRERVESGHETIGTWEHEHKHWPFPKGNVPFGGSNVPFRSATKETMCPLAPPQNQQYFNIHLNYLNLKTVWALNIELSEHWTQLKCFVDNGTHVTNVWY